MSLALATSEGNAEVAGPMTGGAKLRQPLAHGEGRTPKSRVLPTQAGNRGRGRERGYILTSLIWICGSMSV